jgi:hypothetical protein
MSISVPEDHVVVSCPECRTSNDVPVDDVSDRLERHNSNIHEGEAVATVDPRFVDRLQEEL